MNRLARTEYFALRLIRRFLFDERLANRLAEWLPHYRKSVNETRPETIVAAYRESLARAGLVMNGKRVLEVGAGRTNGVGYGLAAEGADQVWTLEPFAPYDADMDLAMLHARHGEDAGRIAQRTHRVRDFIEMPSSGIDLLLSNSVLEHVTEPDAFFAQCRRVLNHDGVMLHRVDYRDHFFKYPYAFLTYSDRTWSRWLDPGDLPRWRLGDHVSALQRAGFSVEVIERTMLPDEFERVRNRLATRFAAAGPDVAVSQATLLARTAG